MRPAALLVRTAAGFDADVRISNATRGLGPVSARSLNAVATLGVRYGDSVLLQATGPQAQEALASIRQLADDGFGEPQEVRPATASSFAVSAGSRLSGAVITATSSTRSMPSGEDLRDHPAHRRADDVGPVDSQRPWPHQYEKPVAAFPTLMMPSRESGWLKPVVPLSEPPLPYWAWARPPPRKHSMPP